MPEQVQDFYPTPGTVSTVMYATGIDPLTGKRVYMAREYHEKQLQRALLQYSKPQNADLVREALRLAGREDLIGFDAHCLVRPAAGQNTPTRVSGKGKKPRSGSGVQYNGARRKTGEKKPAAQERFPARGKAPVRGKAPTRGKTAKTRK